MLSELFALWVLLIEEYYDDKQASSYLDFATDENWLKRLVYLADIFGALNIPNLTLKGKAIHKCCTRKNGSNDHETSTLGS